MITSLHASSSNGPAVRIGDVERQEAVSSLADHLAAGRLTLSEYDERIQLAYAARTRADLAPLFGDLPVAVPSRQRRGHHHPHSLGQATARRGRPSPAILLIAFLLLAGSVGLHLPR